MEISKKARIVHGFAIDVVIGDPSEFFHPSISAEFVNVPDYVEIGWELDKASGNWSPPAHAEYPKDAGVEAAKVSPVQFKLLFTASERVAIKAARASDPVIDDFYDIVEDPRLTFVDLGLQSTKEAIGYLQSKGLITEERAAAILTGVLV